MGTSGTLPKYVSTSFCPAFDIKQTDNIKAVDCLKAFLDKQITIKHTDMETKAKILFDDALTKLQRANEELYRPEEDVVSYSACKNAQNAIESFLKGYLLQSGIDPAPFTTIKSLYENCISHNSQFEKINISALNCSERTIDHKYCNDLEKISHCLEAANNLDNFLKKEKVL